MESMSPVSERGLDGPPPDWVSAWMPQRHVEIMAEIERLKEEARQIESLGRLLWQTGPPLAEAVRDVFLAVGLEAELAPPTDPLDLVVRFPDGRQLAILVTGTEESVTNRSPKIRLVFEAAQAAGETARVVLIGNVHRERPVADREWLDPVASDALMVLTGLGAVFLTTATLFRVWMLSKENPRAAAARLVQLHDVEAGTYLLDQSSGGGAEEDESLDDGAGEDLGLADRLVSALKA